MMRKRQCGTCGKTKPLNEFYKNSRTRDGRQSRCKRCQSEYHAAWKAKRLERFGKAPGERRTGVPYQAAIPPEKWGTVNTFLRAFVHYGRTAIAAGAKPDVTGFMKAFVDYEGYEGGEEDGPKIGTDGENVAEGKSGPGL